MSLVYLALGSNLGEREANLRAARERLATQVRILKTSAVYETEPWGFREQPAFLNQVLKGRTALAPLELLDFLKSIEAALGREANFRYGPRVIDLDILFYGRQVLDTQRLQIPHPRLHERAFVLVPLAEIAPGLIHPVLRKRVSTLLRDAAAKDEVHFWA